MKKKRIVSLLLAGVMAAAVFSLAACSDSERGYTTVKFLYGGPAETIDLFNGMLEQFRATAGEEKKISIKGNPVGETALPGAVTQRMPNASGPDVAVITDHYFKFNCRFFEDMSNDFDADFRATLYPNAEIRGHYDLEKTTSNADDPLYGLPVMNDTSVLFYNRTALEAAGVKCISVEESDMDAFNAGAPDKNGNTKESLGIPADVTIPKKGFFRSISPYLPSSDVHDGSQWRKPASNELMVFNDSIAMNWDEVEDVAMICTKTRNNTSLTDYGYYTEWWFDYGWSVGGDCLQDMSGNGDWTMSLASSMPNYIVNEGKTYFGPHTGTTYEAGDTLDLRDIVGEQGDVISYYTDDKTEFYYTVNGQKAEVRDDITAKENDGTLTELPSIKEALARFSYLAGVGGINVSPYPSAFNNTPSETYFSSGHLAFLVELISCYDYIGKNADFEWGVARMPVFKEYTDPSDPYCDTVAKQGKSAYHSTGYSIVVKKNTKVRDAAIEFVRWMMTDGQKWLADQGYFSSRKQDREAMVENSRYGNGEFLASAMEEARPGDWWYMPDRVWIDEWAVPLNNNVRYGTMSFEEFIYKYITATNKALASYKKA